MMEVAEAEGEDEEETKMPRVGGEGGGGDDDDTGEDGSAPCDLLFTLQTVTAADTPPALDTAVKIQLNALLRQTVVFDVVEALRMVQALTTHNIEQRWTQFSIKHKEVQVQHEKRLKACQGNISLQQAENQRLERQQTELDQEKEELEAHTREAHDRLLTEQQTLLQRVGVPLCKQSHSIDDIDAQRAVILAIQVAWAAYLLTGKDDFFEVQAQEDPTAANCATNTNGNNAQVTGDQPVQPIIISTPQPMKGTVSPQPTKAQPRATMTAKQKLSAIMKRTKRNPT